MNPDLFPVVDERPLVPPERRWLRRPRRDPALLPPLPPGCVYVFATGSGRYTVCRDPADLRGTDPAFVEAKWASMVSTRLRQITATAWLPSKKPTDEFVVTAVFGCKVEQPAEVAEHGPVDLQQHLDVQLRLNTGLLELEHKFGVEEIGVARSTVIECLTRAYQHEIPSIRGVAITFDGAYLHTPSGLRRHHAELRDTIWAREVEELREKHELDRVKHTEKLLTTPEQAQAAAIARQETNTLHAAERGFQERGQRTQHLVEQVQKWLDTDSGRRALIDRSHLAEELFAQLTGKRVPAGLAQAHQNGKAGPPDDDGPLQPPSDRISPQ